MENKTENKISIDDVKKVEIRIGKILSAENIEGSEKLLKLSVDFGEDTPRTVLSGIAKYFPGGEGLAGIKCAFVANLEPRAMMGMESQGMILATSGENFFSLLKVSDDVPAGSIIK
jgi:methionine--tRNA ligase beta chain